MIYQVEDGCQPLRVFAGGQPGDQSVQDQFQVALQHVAGYVLADPVCLLLPLQPIMGCRGQFRG